MKQSLKTFTDKLTEAIDLTDVAWRKQWVTVGGFPKNAQTEKGYSGVNCTRLIMAGYDVPDFIGFKQLAKMGKKFRPAPTEDNPKATAASGRGIHILIPTLKIRRTYGTWEPIIDPDTGEPERYLTYKVTPVFNMSLVEGFELPKLSPNANYVDDIETALKQWDDAPSITHQVGQGCFYRRTDHEIVIPDVTYFENPIAYYGTLFHELIHSTAKGLDRECHKLYHKARKHRALEELVAEIGSMMLCAHFKIENQVQIEMTASYVKSWQSELNEGIGASVQKASGMAQQAVNLILKGASDALD